MSKILKQTIAVKPQHLKAALRIAPALSQFFTRYEREADVNDVLQTALHRGLISMELDFCGRRSPLVIRASGRHSLLCRESRRVS